MAPVNAQDEPPKRISSRPPIFSYLAKVQCLFGYSVVEFTITELGDVRNAPVVETSHEDFRETSIDCIQSWKFTPAKRGGKPAAMRVRQRLDFTLEGSAAVLGTRSSDGIQLDLNDEWTVAPGEPDKKTNTESLLRVYKCEIQLEVSVTSKRDATALENYAIGELDRRNNEAFGRDGYRLFEGPVASGPFKREVAGEFRDGFRFRTKRTEERGGQWMLLEFFKFTADGTEFRVMASYPTDSSTDSQPSGGNTSPHTRSVSRVNPLLRCREGVRCHPSRASWLRVKTLPINCIARVA